MSRGEALGWQVGCVLGAVVGVVIVELGSEFERAAWSVCHRIARRFAR